MILRSAFKPPLPLLCWNSNLEDRLAPGHNRRRRLQLRAQYTLDDLLRSLSPPAAALGVVSGAAILLSSFRRRLAGGADPEAEMGGDAVVGDWILFTSPTPFNRCVLLRCPSVSFEDGGELLDGVNDRLVREERHYVNLSRGTIPTKSSGAKGLEDEVSYQRVCVGTEDGGVLSLDWPANLDLGREHGLDTTVLIVPGTTEGSMDRNVRVFVHDALNHGYFPIVMNPRGCAGSPLTTARLFTAADSDDICTAINYIKKARQWTTLMSIGWGYGANMLTKYLAEAGQTTPLTAAVCIDNPFDLEEATRSFPHHVAMDQKLKSGLVNILRANKELFQGKSKGFDVARALSATSLRDFDVAVSMISYGFDVVEDFYSKSSTRELVSNVKIPLLFIQSDDGTVPLFSIPRSLITENPFTSLLLCSCMPSSTNASWRCSILWSQRLAIEWLAGVEFAFLKGRHPLLKDVDVTINPSKGVAFVQKKASESGITTKKKISASYDLAHLFLNNNEDTLFVPAQTDYVNGFLPTPNVNVLQGSDAAIEKDEHNAVVNANDGKGDDNLDSEKSQVLQTAAVVINMLDVTMPSTLDDTQKKKVFSALEQGETLMKALQEAVPEDVRGKLTAAASEILRTQSTNLSFDSVRRIGWIPKLTSEVKSSVQGKLNTASDTGRSQGNDPLLEHYKMDSGSSIASQDSAYPQLRDNSAQESSVPQQNNTPNSGNSGIDSEIGGKPSQHDKHEKVSVGSDEAVAEHYVVNQTDGVADKNSADNQMVTNDKDEKSVQQSGLKGVDFVAEQNVLDSSNGSEGGPVSSISSQLAVDKKLNESQKGEDNVNEDVSGQIAQSSTKPEEASTQQSSQKSSTINVGEALNALTGFDDSTQMAVNSVFGVLEGMIDQLEKASNQRNGADIAENADRHSAPALSDSSSIGSNESQQVKAVDDILRVVSNMGKPPKGLEDSCHGDNTDSREELEGKSGDNKEDRGLSSASLSKKNGVGVDQMCRESIDKVGHVPYFPMAMDVSLHTHLGSPYALYLHKYCSSHLPITKSVVSDSTTDLFWDTDSGQWKMLEQSKDHFCENEKNKYINGKSQPMHCTANVSNDKEIIEPSYIILDAGELDYTNYDSKLSEAKRDILLCLISNDLLEALKVEIGRRSGIFALEETEIGLIGDLEQVVDAVAKAVVYDNEVNLDLLSETNGLGSEKLGVIEGECIIKTISSAFKDASHLGNVLPVGVIVGSTLACLRKYFQVTTLHVDGHAEPFCDKHELIQHNRRSTESEHFVNVGGQCVDSDKPSNESTDELQEHNSKNNSLMVGAVTAALGASALVAQHQKNLKDEKREFPSRPSSSKELLQERCDKLEEAVQEKSQNNLVSSLAEKAMSVAGPVVPTTSDGEVDQERLVALLAELGQKGGILRLIGKIALLWGGIRGAMSLTDRLISFLRISECPLLQRICGFVCMALVLWSPVVIPLLPTLVQSWTTKTPNVIAEYACIVGLYVAITILVMLWGKRIRGYDNPIKQYGLDLGSAPRVQDFLKGLVGGTLMVLCIHSLNVLLGYGWLAWPLSPPSSSGGAVLLLKTYGNMLVQVVRGTMTAFGIAVVEELLFRSWLPEEMAVDLGHYQAILISGLAFSLVQRSLHSTPGFFLFSLALFGIKQRAHGKLAAPIGIRTGVMTTNFFLQTGGFLRFRHGLPFWLISTHPLHPFDGAIGLGFLVMLTILYFPWWRRSSAGVTEESI